MKNNLIEAKARLVPLLSPSLLPHPQALQGKVEGDEGETQSGKMDKYGKRSGIKENESHE